MDIGTLKNKILQVENELENMKSQLNKIEMEEEKKDNPQYPDVLQEFYNNILDIRIQRDNRMKIVFKREYKKLGDAKFKEFYTQADYDLLNKSKKQIEADNILATHQTMISLNERIKAVVGGNMDVSQLSYNPNTNELIGIVSGDKGRANLKTSIAGGFNKQKFHIRFFIKSIDNKK